MSASAGATLVWTERRAGSWDQCTECAYLMALHAGGFRGFPLGAYSAAERDALDAAAEPDPPAGGSTFPIIDRGALARYGRKLRTIADGSRAGLPGQLAVPGRALAIAGRLSHFPAGHRLRRWQPGYSGGHAITAIALGAGAVRWLDPLAPAGFAGDTVTIAEVLTFAWYPNDARVTDAREHEVIPMAYDFLKGAAPLVNRRAAIAGGATVRSTPACDPKAPTANRLLVVADRGSGAPARAWVAGTNVTLGTGAVLDPRTRWLALQAEGYGIGFVHERDVVAVTPDEAIAAELIDQLDAAVTALDRIRRLARQAAAVAAGGG